MKYSSRNKLTNSTTVLKVFIFLLLYNVYSLVVAVCVCVCVCSSFGGGAVVLMRTHQKICEAILEEEDGENNEPLDHLYGIQFIFILHTLSTVLCCKVSWKRTERRSMIP